MQRKKQLSLILGTGALALLANAPFAQTSSSNDQAVSPSATTSVDANTRFKAMPHSTVTVSPNATTNQNTSTNQSTSTTGVTSSTGAGTATKGGTGSTDSGSTRAGAGSTGMASAGSSSGSRTGGDAVASGSASSNMATDRNANSPGKGWAKGRDKHDKDLDAHDDQDSGKSSSRR